MYRHSYVTVADDLTEMTHSRTEMLVMVPASAGFANGARFVIQPTKSCILTYWDECLQHQDDNYSWFHRPSVLFRISIGTQVTCTYITWLSQPIEICSITMRPSSHVLEASIKTPKEILFYKQIFYWPFQGGTSFVDLLCFCSVLCLLCFVRVCLYVLRGHLLGKGWPLGSRLWCLLWVCHFPIGILGQVWYLIVSIPDLCNLTYFVFIAHEVRISCNGPLKAAVFIVTSKTNFMFFKQHPWLFTGWWRQYLVRHITGFTESVFM